MSGFGYAGFVCGDIMPAVNGIQAGNQISSSRAGGGLDLRNEFRVMAGGRRGPRAGCHRFGPASQ